MFDAKYVLQTVLVFDNQMRFAMEIIYIDMGLFFSKCMPNTLI